MAQQFNFFFKDSPVIQPGNTGGFRFFFKDSPEVQFGLGPPVIRDSTAPVEFKAFLVKDSFIPIDSDQPGRVSPIPISFLQGVARGIPLPTEWGGPELRERDSNIPVEGTSTTERESFIPTEWDGVKVRERDIVIPFEFFGVVVRDTVLPFESDGIPAFALPDIFTAIRVGSFPFTDTFTVVPVLFEATLEDEFNVLEAIAPLADTFIILPDDTLTLFDEDIQRPVQKTTKTP